MVLLFAGFTGKAFTTEKEFVLGYGEEQQIGRYSVTFESLAHREDPHKSTTAAALSLRRDGEFLATLLPERRFYHRSEQNTTEVAIWSSRLEDFYLILVGTASDDSTKFQVYINPARQLCMGGWSPVSAQLPVGHVAIRPRAPTG